MNCIGHYILITSMFIKSIWVCLLRTCFQSMSLKVFGKAWIYNFTNEISKQWFISMFWVYGIVAVLERCLKNISLMRKFLSKKTMLFYISRSRWSMYTVKVMWLCWPLNQLLPSSGKIVWTELCYLDWDYRSGTIGWASCYRNRVSRI